jgi:TonB family protein
MIKVSLIITCGLIAAVALRRQSAALRHWVLAATILCAAAAPLLERIVPSWQIDASPAAVADVQQGLALLFESAESAPPTAPSRPGEGAAAARRPNVARMLGLVWLTGAGTALFVLAVGLGRLRWLAVHASTVSDGLWLAEAGRIADAYGVRRPITILQSAHPSLLMTWGLVRPRVLLPSGAQGWPVERVRVVLGHELAHIRRGDWAAQLVAEILRAVYWFNPLVWIASARLRRESEQACDDAVLSLGVDGPTYAAHLLDLARAAAASRRTAFPPFPAPAMVRPSSLERRVVAMLNVRLNRTPTTGRTRIVTIAAALALAVLIAGFSAAAQRFARFTGSIFDPHNGTVPKVTVILTHAQSQAKYEVKSDESGRFEFPALPAGEYRLEAKYPGFMTFTGTVGVGAEDLHRNLALQIGLLQETITVSAAPGTATAADPVRAPRPVVQQSRKACTPTAAGGNIRPPMKILDVRPIYPQHAQEAGAAGTVQLQARIGPDGNVADVQVAETPHPDLGTAAMDAVRQWQFTPTLLNCVPVGVSMNVTVTFQLEK